MERILSISSLKDFLFLWIDLFRALLRHFFVKTNGNWTATVNSLFFTLLFWISFLSRNFLFLCAKKKERKKRKEKTTIICIFFSDCIGLFVRWEQRPTCTRGHDHIPDQHSCHHFYHCWGFRYVYVLASFNRMWLQFKLVSG